ncbi:MAG TPA: hypothetical protein VJT71_19275 [Pyrinomonadaceae bacterium]|nr:hypothetical protein [Pyrinomonadaceae bacterium]
MTAIAFICTANRCRSLMAHAILVNEARKRSLNIEVYSAGVIDFSDQPPLEKTLKTCLHFNTQAPKTTPTFVLSLPLDAINLFLAMERHHADSLTREFGISASRVSLLGSFDPRKRGDEISDPFFSYDEMVYRRSYELIRDCIVGYLDTTENLA